MKAITIRAMLVLVALMTLEQQRAHAKAGQGSDCLAQATEKRVVYCESIAVGDIALAAKNVTATLIVSFESKFFSGLERINTSHGSVFRKAGHSVSNYPGVFSVAIEPPLDLNQLGKSSPAPLPRPAVRLPPEMRPRRIIVRWFDSSQHVLAERSTDLEEVEEAWPELRQPRVWYRATITGVNGTLASSVEVQVRGDGDAVLGTMRGRL